MSNVNKSGSGQVNSSSISRNKGKTGITRKEKHLSAENKRKQASKDKRNTGKKG